MSNFALKRIEAVIGKQAFYDLIIDGVSQADEFMLEIKGNSQYESEVRTILAYMDLVANMVLLPKTKFRDITPEKEKAKEYEFKSDHLRVYTFHLEKTGKIVSYWGFKNNQDKDIKRFRSLKKQFLENQSS